MTCFRVARLFVCFHVASQFYVCDVVVAVAASAEQDGAQGGDHVRAALLHRQGQGTGYISVFAGALFDLSFMQQSILTLLGSQSSFGFHAELFICFCLGICEISSYPCSRIHH